MFGTNGNCKFLLCEFTNRIAHMSGISKDDVAHLGRLARIDIPEDQLEHYAKQLDAILDAVAQVPEVAAKDVPAGKPYKIVDVADIPTDRTFRNAWEYQT